ncbi:SCO5918 family protein [Streptomyces anandii]|uniref:SCO5918 family protein n=1 Tax=Streptomyces anandii TaxID=285454 RepID=UPI0036C51BD8
MKRCVIARHPFEPTENGAPASPKSAGPELVTGDSVTIGRRRYPIEQVGRVITRKDGPAFRSGGVLRAPSTRGGTAFP